MYKDTKNFEHTIHTSPAMAASTDECKACDAPTFSLIAALHLTHGGMGCTGHIPWDLPADLKHFARMTANSLSKMARS